VISNETLTVEQLIYLAGFFDGEGSLGVYPVRKKYWRARIKITQNRSKHIDRLFGLWARVFGGNAYVQCGGRVLNLYIERRTSCMAFIKYVGPYCIGKKRQMVVMENWLSDRAYSNRVAQTLKALKDIKHG